LLQTRRHASALPLFFRPETSFPLKKTQRHRSAGGTRAATARLLRLWGGCPARLNASHLRRSGSPSLRCGVWPRRPRVRVPSTTPFFDSLPIPTSAWAFFYFHAKHLVVKGFAKQYPIPRILRREPLAGGLAHDFNEKRPKFSGRLEQATSPRRSSENRLNEKHTPVCRPLGSTSSAREKSGGELSITINETRICDFSSAGHRFATTIKRGADCVKNPLVVLTFPRFHDLTETDRVSSTVTLVLGKVCFDLKCPSRVRSDRIVRRQLLIFRLTPTPPSQPPARDLLPQNVRSFCMT